MKKEVDNRGFSRFPMDFVLEVYSEDAEEEKFEDQAVLENISGGGAKFSAKKSDMYYPGQLLEIKILLPRTDKIEAFMKVKAGVIRIDFSNTSVKNNKSSKGCIAVKFKTRFSFKKTGI